MLEHSFPETVPGIGTAQRVLPPPIRSKFLDCIVLCVRVPKSGSESLRSMVTSAFGGNRIFHLPTSLSRDGEISSFQALRFHRTFYRNLYRAYGTINLPIVMNMLNATIDHGDLIAGGHIDFPFIRRHIEKRVKCITLLRNPASRVHSEYHYARQGYFRKNGPSRLDANLSAKIAARYSFSGYIGFLFENRTALGNVAAAYLGWDGRQELSGFIEHNVFHSGLLEQPDHFTRGLSEKLARPLSLPHLNRTHKSPLEHISKADMTKIERIYEHDFTLYEWHRDCM